MTDSTEDTRWKQRFQNFSRAMTLLRSALEEYHDLATVEPIIKEGMIQRFEYTIELAWKTLKDKMQEDGLKPEKISPKFVFKLAYQAKYIDDIEVWLKIIEERNLLAHTYNFETFDKALLALKETYFPVIDKLYMSLLEEMLPS